MDQFVNRHEAGKYLAEKLKNYTHQPDVIVLGLPRGGVPVAYEIAQALSVPLDVLVVRKLGVPGHEELAMGAIASGGAIVFNDDIVREIQISKNAIDQVIQIEKEELKRRENKYRDYHPFPELSKKTIILVDDGIATGATMRAAIKALRQHHPAKIILAIPVAGMSTCQEMENLADQVICLLRPVYFNAVGEWYQDFSQTSDEEVYELLKERTKGDSH